MGDDVHERHLLGEPDRVVEGQDRGRQPDAHPGRAGRERGGERGRIDGQAVVDEVVLGEPHLVEAQLLGQHHLIQLAADDLVVPPAGRGLQEEVGAEAHQVTPR